MEDKDDEMSLDGMSIESDSLAIHEHPAEEHEEQGANHRSQSPDARKPNGQQQYDADSSRPSVIETAKPQVIECT